MSRRAPRLTGFTLLEVMAAVLVLGLLYTVLAEAAIRGLRSEGISRRRVEASLIADRWLADLEAQVALGQIPPTGSEDQAIDPYQVRVSVQPFDPTPMLEAVEALKKERGIDDRSGSQRPMGTDDSQGAAGATRGAQAGPGPGDPGPISSLLTQPSSADEGRLRRIDVAVAWQEGDREERVLRTTFVFDTTGLESLFPEKGGEGGAGAEAAAGNDGTPNVNPTDLDGLDPEEAASRMREVMEQMGGVR